MLEHFNDYISIAILIAILLFFVYFGLRSILNFVERTRIKKRDGIFRKKKEGKLVRKSVNSLSVPRKKGAYSQVLKVGDFVFISGQSGINKDSSMSKTLEDQVKTIFNNTNLLLEELKMHINQVVRTVIYVVDSVDMDVVDKIYETQFKHPLPARSVIFVNRLEDKDALIEISFDAIDLSAYEAMQGCSDEGCDDCEDDECEHS